jgi:hypothetical protein
MHRFYRVFFIVQCFLFLFIILVIDHAFVLRAYIIALLFIGGWIVCFPENFEQFIITDLCRVVYDTCEFNMAGIFIANLFIGWIYLHGRHHNRFLLYTRLPVFEKKLRCTRNSLHQK